MTRDAVQTATVTEPGETRPLPYDSDATYDDRMVTYDGAIEDRRHTSTTQTVRRSLHG